eukprot:8734199-Lingulodinium_polyedra.AAC.1
MCGSQRVGRCVLCSCAQQRATVRNATPRLMAIRTHVARARHFARCARATFCTKGVLARIAWHRFLI